MFKRKPRYRVCKCALSGEVHVFDPKENMCCEICTYSEPLTEEVAKAVIEDLNARLRQAEANLQEALRYVDD